MGIKAFPPVISDIIWFLNLKCLSGSLWKKQCNSRRPRGTNEKMAIFVRGHSELLTLKLRLVPDLGISGPWPHGDQEY